MERQPLSDTEYRWFSEWVGEEFGIRFGAERRDILRSRLEPLRIELGFETFEQLYFHLRYHPEGGDERERLIPYLTNNESYFFREPAQLEILRTEVLPEVRKRLESGSRQEIRLLSAGCAAGEEAYTLAIVAGESGVVLPPWSFRVTGVDIDPEALARARAARYTENAFRRVERSVVERYFSPAGTAMWQLNSEARRGVCFRRANLADAGWTAGIPRQDVIFCRNVLIYFGEATVQQVVEGLYELLQPGGYLFLGHSETLHRIATRFLTVRRAGAVYYRRGER